MIQPLFSALLARSVASPQNTYKTDTLSDVTSEMRACVQLWRAPFGYKQLKKGCHLILLETLVTRITKYILISIPLGCCQHLINLFFCNIGS